MRGDQIALKALGPLTVVVGDQPVVVAGKLKQRCVARLTLEMGRPVTADILIDAMWGESAPRTAKQSLHVHISAIRDRLRPFGAEGLITTIDVGEYALGINPDAVDIQQFSTEVDDGIRALQQQRFAYAARQLGTAVDRFADPFPSLVDYAPAIPERHRLIAIFEQACDSRIDALLAMGSADQSIPLLRATIASAPLRERPYEQLIHAYRSVGDEVRARQVLVDATKVFHDALGLAPSDALVDLATGTATTSPSTSSTGAGPAGRRQTRSLAIEPPGRWLVASTDHDVILDLGDRSVRSHRARLTAEGDGLGLTPLLDFADLSLDLDLTDLTLKRNATFQRIARGIESSDHALLIIEDLHYAAPVLVDFLVWALSRPGSVPMLSFVGLYDPTTDADAIQRLRAHCETVDLATTAHAPTSEQHERPVGLGDAECELLNLMHHAILPVPTELVVAAASLPAASVKSGLQQLRARDILVDRPGKRADLASPHRRRGVSTRSSLVDLRLADSIAEHLDDHDPYRLVAEAHHRLHALPDGDNDTAWEAALRAAERFDALDSHHDLTALNRLAPHLGDDGLTRDELRFRLLVGRAMIRTGDPSGGETLLRSLLPLARETHDDLFAAAVRFLIERTTPQLQPDSRTLTEEALSRLGPEPSDLRVQLLSDLSGMWFLIDPAKSAELAEECLTNARAAAHATSIATALTGKVQAIMRPDNAAGRLKLAIEAQQWARQASSTESLCLALTYEAQALIEQGLLARATAPLRYAQALSDQIQVPRFCWWADAWSALLDFAGGEIDDAEARFIAAHDRWPGARDPVQCLGVQLATLWLLQGRGGDLLPMLDQYDTQGTDAAISSTRAFALAQSGRKDEAIVIVDTLVESGVIDGVKDITKPFALAMTAEAASLCNHTSAGPELVRLIEPLADVHITLNVWGGGGCYWGSMLHALGLSQALAAVPASVATLHAAAAANSDAGASVFAARSHAKAEQQAASG